MKAPPVARIGTAFAKMNAYYLSDGSSEGSSSSSEAGADEGEGRFFSSSTESSDGEGCWDLPVPGPGLAEEVRETLQREPCLCEGSFDDGEHCVFLAFLHYRNEEHAQEQCMQDYRIVPMNWLATKLTASDIYHCQTFFWDNPRRTFVSISVDTNHNGVHEYDKKTFRRGWTFLRLKLEKWQENGVISFLRAQLGKPMNLLGLYACLFLPISGKGQSYFCSELCLAALQSVGVFSSLPQAGTSPAALFRAVCESGELEYSESRHPVVMQSNKAYWEEQKKTLCLETERRKAEKRARKQAETRLRQENIIVECSSSSSSSSESDEDTSSSGGEESAFGSGKKARQKKTTRQRAALKKRGEEEDSLQQQLHV